jgi:7,8-dihydroneopterin aldolase/epimerase/oxygenase
MNDLITIELNQLRFFAYHGLYAEEKKTGNQFEIDLTVSHLPLAGIITDLKETINYVSLYNLLSSEMQKPRHLLETFVMETTEMIHQVFPGVKKIEISIKKLQPPIAAFTGSVGVKYCKEY